ncbi:hypothetical protein [Pectobacterium punjabense]|uniref:hypothetical protein n=1 Tax=Pectobacterium punjabense TaxID=2108399 RepID=UPI00240627AF|nr:hypothetical protein [Pectobacterium punjabense]MDG0799492.1 hypothetical protein [Pectobacterium punjabense]
MDSIVENIAYKLFLERSDSLEYELTAQEIVFLNKKTSNDYYIENGKLIFESFSKRDKKIAVYYFSNIHFDNIDIDIDIDIDKKIIQTAIDIWKIGLRGDCSVAGLFLSLCENKINIWKALSTYEDKPYEVTSLTDQFIKHTKNIEISDIFYLFSNFYKKNNSYICIFSELETRLANAPQKCHEIINYFHSDIKQDTITLYSIALFSLKKSNYSTTIDILLNDIEKNDPILSPQSLWILGKIIEKDNAKYQKDKITSIIEKRISDSTPAISDAAIQATINSIEKIPDFRQIIHNLMKIKHKKAIEFLCQRILITKELKTHPDFPLWMTDICLNVEDNGEIYKNIFHILASLVDNEHMHEVLINCTFIMEKNGSIQCNENEFNYLLQSISKKTSLINKLFTLSLISENSARLAKLISTHLMVYGNTSPLKYSLDIINDFSDSDFIFLLRRMLGFISEEASLMSLTLSLLEANNAKKRTHAIVKSVIIKEIAIDYPYFVIETIKEYKNKIRDRNKIYDEIISCIEINIECINKLPRRKEFEPSTRHVLSFQKERSKVMEKQQEISNENSPFLKIATPIILKAGVASFYYDDYKNNEYSEPSFLHSFSSNYSLPRRYIMDNIGYEIHTAMLRMVKKENA